MRAQYCRSSSNEKAGYLPALDRLALTVGRGGVGALETAAPVLRSRQHQWGHQQHLEIHRDHRQWSPLSPEVEVVNSGF